MILGRYLLTEFSDHVIKADDENFKGYTATTVDLGKYEFKY